MISHGTVDELARSFVRGILPFVEEMKAMEKLEEKEREAQEAQLSSRMVDFQKQLRPLVNAMCKLEDRPEDIAHVNAIIYEEVLGLSPALKRSVEQVLLTDFRQLKQDGLITSLRPKKNVETWVARRQVASQAMEQHLRALMPEESLSHPIFETQEGFLLDLTEDELQFLEDDAKATPQPTPENP